MFERWWVVLWMFLHVCENVTVEEMVWKAVELQRVGELDEAAAVCTDILEIEPKNIDAFQVFGIIEMQRNHLEHAELLMKKSIEMDPTNSVYHSNLGAVLRSLHRYEEALEHLQRSLQLDPTSQGAIQNMALVYQDQRQYDKAIESFLQFLQTDPMNHSIRLQLGRVFQFKFSLEFSNLFLLAHVYFTVGLFKEAENDFNFVRNQAEELDEVGNSIFLNVFGIIFCVGVARDRNFSSKAGPFQASIRIVSNCG